MERMSQTLRKHDKTPHECTCLATAWLSGHSGNVNVPDGNSAMVFGKCAALDCQGTTPALKTLIGLGSGHVIGKPLRFQCAPVVDFLA